MILWCTNMKRGLNFFPWFWNNAVQSTGRYSLQTSRQLVKADFSKNLMSKFASSPLRSTLHFFWQQSIKWPKPIFAPSKFLLLLSDDNNKPAIDCWKKIATRGKHKQPITQGSYWVCAYFLHSWLKANGWTMIAKEAISSSKMVMHPMDCFPLKKKSEAMLIN